ncbi:hypothetical protein BJ546DRAFT_1101991, partial [Cryomyces antarcticus]
RESPGKSLYVIYNCTTDAGCSREHKHPQVFERPTDDSTGTHAPVPFPDRTGSDVPRAPFQYFIHRFQQDELLSDELLVDVYRRLLKQTRRALRIPTDDSGIPCPHNVVLVNEWVMLIPRVTSNVHGASANAAGMMGMVWVTREEDVDRWRELGPAKVLS